MPASKIFCIIAIQWPTEVINYGGLFYLPVFITGVKKHVDLGEQELLSMPFEGK